MKSSNGCFFKKKQICQATPQVGDPDPEGTVGTRPVGGGPLRLPALRRFPGARRGAGPVPGGIGGGSRPVGRRLDAQDRPLLPAGGGPADPEAAAEGTETVTAAASTTAIRINASRDTVPKHKTHPIARNSEATIEQ